ncbi:MAG: glycosyl transferase, partial [Actinomycetales bacterium]
MIGYYVHHHGRGHLNRALSINAELGPVVGLSSLPRPAQWIGPWIELPRDDDRDVLRNPTAGGALHWVPEQHRGLRERMHEVSSWISDIEPELMVVDVSVEVALLARLHGVPVVTSVLPGDRSDPPHELVHTAARAVIAPWPSSARSVLRAPATADGRLETVGAFSRFDGRAVPERADPGRRVVLMLGAGGHALAPEVLDLAREQTSGWEWTVLGLGDTWADDPWESLCAADVVVTHSGQNAVAEVAAARRPAVVVPQDRPF